MALRTVPARSRWSGYLGPTTEPPGPGPASPGALHRPPARQRVADRYPRCSTRAGLAGRFPAERAAGDPGPAQRDPAEHAHPGHRAATPTRGPEPSAQGLGPGPARGQRWGQPGLGLQPADTERENHRQWAGHHHHPERHRGQKLWGGAGPAGRLRGGHLGVAPDPPGPGPRPRCASRRCQPLLPDRQGGHDRGAGGLGDAPGEHPPERVLTAWRGAGSRPGLRGTEPAQEPDRGPDPPAHPSGQAGRLHRPEPAFRICQKHGLAVVRGFDGDETIVPNVDMLSGSLVNWTFKDLQMRRSITVGVAYGSPTQTTMDLLVEAAQQAPCVLKAPAPVVYFTDFGDSALVFQLKFWVEMGALNPHVIETAVRLRINEAIKAANITISFPQRDLHLYQTEPLHVDICQK